MGQTNNIKLQRIIKQRNKVFDQLEFLEQYLPVYENQIDQKNGQYMAGQTVKKKKRLLPLELKACPEAQANRWKIDNQMHAAKERQIMTRRAIQQKYTIDSEKMGEAAARRERDQKIAQLDKKLEEKRNKLEIRYPIDSPKLPTTEEINTYLETEKVIEKKLSDKYAELEKKKKEKIAKQKNLIEEKQKKLQSKFEILQKKLDSYSKISEEDFGRDTLLKIQNLKMYFSGVKAVDDISFDIKKGEIFGLIGPNGAGKTTIFNCVTQFYKPTAGNVFYRDRFGKIVDLTDYKTYDVIKCGISRTFQNLEMVLGLSILDNLKVGAHSLYRSSLFDHFFHTKRLKNEEEVTKAKAERILEKLELLPYKDDFPKGQPYGVLKKVELGRTLMTSPQLIILDEPAAGLNDVETEELAKTICQIREDFDCTIFLVEHDMNLVMNICDRICVASFGKRLAIGTPEEIQADPLVQEAYLGTKGDEEV